MAGNTLFSSKIGDIAVTSTGMGILQSATPAAAQQVLAPGATILSPAATAAIAALTSGSDAAAIVAALQAT